MIDRMKDLEFRLQEKQNLLHGQDNAVNKTFVPTNELNVKKDKDFVDLVTTLKPTQLNFSLMKILELLMRKIISI